MSKDMNPDHVPETDEPIDSDVPVLECWRCAGAGEVPESPGPLRKLCPDCGGSGIQVEFGDPVG